MQTRMIYSNDSVRYESLKSSTCQKHAMRSFPLPKYSHQTVLDEGIFA